MKQIVNRWQAATKTAGAHDVFFCPSGLALNGCFILCDCGSVTPSHDVFNGFSPSVGFPSLDGETVNDRDYQHDRHAQQITRDIARNFDGRALQEWIVVSPDGVVLSGNGRTMARQLAAADNTDGKYISYLLQCCNRFGIDAAEVRKYNHPFLVFVLAEALPYTAATFALFNQDGKKGQDKTETAIKYGKTIDDATFSRIISTVNGFETLAEYFANAEAVTRCVNDLCRCGAIEPSKYNVLFDGDGISLTGREIIENVLTGKAFAGDPDCVRMCTEFRSLRRCVVFALAEMANNIRLGDYSLQREICDAVRLVYAARKAGYKAGEKVSEYARQMTIFGGCVSDYANADTMYFADMLNGGQQAALKRFLTIYNHTAKDFATGQASLFGEIRTKSDVCGDVRAMSEQEQAQAIKDGVTARIAANPFISQQDGVCAGGFAKLLTKSGASIIVKVEKTNSDFSDISILGGGKTSVFTKSLRPCIEHALTLPEWLVAGMVITDGHYCQRVKALNPQTVEFVWINGGTFAEDIATVVTRWQPHNGECEILEVA